MLTTVEAIVDEDGSVRLLEPIQLKRGTRALVTIMSGDDSTSLENAKLSEEALAYDWNRPEEEEAWQHLQA